MINLQQFYSVVRKSDLQYDIQKQLENIVMEINRLSEETNAKRYALLESE